MTWNQAIIDRVEETGHEWYEIKIVPFERSVVGGDPVITGPVVAYGTTGIDTVVERCQWKPGVWRSPGFRDGDVCAALGDLYLNQDLMVIKAKDVPTVVAQKGWDPFFAKPNTDNKEFAGMIFDAERFPFFIEGLITNEWIDEDFEICVSSPREIDIEWRLVVVEGRVVTYSIYKQWQTVMASREIYDDVLDIAAEAITRHDPAPVYVIDVCQFGDGLKIIEYNGFNSAGLYACDVERIVDDINAYVDST